MPSFDIDAARKAGYSDSDIANEIAKNGKFNVAGARQAGYSDSDILSEYKKGISAQSSTQPSILEQVKKAPLDASPVLPEGVVTAGPARLLASIGGGSLGGGLAQKVAEYFGLSPENQQRAQFAGSVAGGALGGAVVPGRVAALQARANPITTPPVETSPEQARAGLPKIPPVLKAILKSVPGVKHGATIYDILQTLSTPAEQSAGVKIPSGPPLPRPGTTVFPNLARPAAPALPTPGSSVFPSAPEPTPVQPGPSLRAPGSSVFPAAEQGRPIQAGPPLPAPVKPAMPKVVPAPAISYPAQAPPTKVVPPPQIKWMERAAAESAPAGTDSVVIRNGKKYVNINGHLLSVTDKK